MTLNQFAKSAVVLRWLTLEERAVRQGHARTAPGGAGRRVSRGNSHRLCKPAPVVLLPENSVQLKTQIP